MRSLLVLTVLLAATAQPAKAEVPEKFVGEWTFEVEEAPGFPWWAEVKYPVTIAITSQGARFKDQAGTTCEPPTFFYDEDLDALIFNHCGSTKSPRAIPPFYRLRVDGARLLGETWKHKLLFRWWGDRSP